MNINKNIPYFFSLALLLSFNQSIAQDFNNQDFNNLNSDNQKEIEKEIGRDYEKINNPSMDYYIDEYIGFDPHNELGDYNNSHIDIIIPSIPVYPAYPNERLPSPSIPGVCHLSPQESAMADTNNDGQLDQFEIDDACIKKEDDMDNLYPYERAPLNINRDNKSENRYNRPVKPAKPKRTPDIPPARPVDKVPLQDNHNDYNNR